MSRLAEDNHKALGAVQWLCRTRSSSRVQSDGQSIDGRRPRSHGPRALGRTRTRIRASTCTRADIAARRPSRICIEAAQQQQRQLILPSWAWRAAEWVSSVEDVTLLATARRNPGGRTVVLSRSYHPPPAGWAADEVVLERIGAFAVRCSMSVLWSGSQPDRHRRRRPMGLPLGPFDVDAWLGCPDSASALAARSARPPLRQRRRWTIVCRAVSLHQEKKSVPQPVRALVVPRRLSALRPSPGRHLGSCLSDAATGGCHHDARESHPQASSSTGPCYPSRPPARAPV